MARQFSVYITMKSTLNRLVFLACCDGQHLHLRSAEPLLQYFMQWGLMGFDDAEESLMDGNLEEEERHIEEVSNHKEFQDSFEKYKSWALGGKWCDEVSAPTYLA